MFSMNLTLFLTLPNSPCLLTQDIVIKQPCSCMHFGQNQVIIGTDRFYKIDAVSYVMSGEFSTRFYPACSHLSVSTGGSIRQDQSCAHKHDFY